jgi:hypothetical protein
MQEGIQMDAKQAQFVRETAQKMAQAIKGDVKAHFSEVTFNDPAMANFWCDATCAAVCGGSCYLIGGIASTIGSAAGAAAAKDI